MVKVVGAVVQAGTPLFNNQATFEKLADLVSDAAAKGASLVVLPEAFIGGYPIGLDFGLRLGSRSPEGRDMFKRYAEQAIKVSGPDAEAIGKIVAKTGIYLVVGVGSPSFWKRNYPNSRNG